MLAFANHRSDSAGAVVFRVSAFSSFADAILRHAREAAERYVADFKLDRSSLVIEVASNDGYFLRNFQGAAIPCLGIEPAANIARVAQEKGIETVVEFFGEPLARRLAAARRQADLILGNNVFAHAPDINDFACARSSSRKDESRSNFPTRWT
jgi:hypothetical protein